MSRGGVAALLAGLTLALQAVTVGHATDAEDFDLSGLPVAPESFLEQQIREQVKTYQKGQLAEARSIQLRLAAVYRSRGDTERAAQAERLAELAATPQPSPPSSAPSEPPAPARTPAKEPPPTQPSAPSKSAAFHGRFYAMAGRLLHTWDFNQDGTFYHATAVSGAGTSVRTGERGFFEVRGGKLILRVATKASAFATPGTGGKSTILGGGQDAQEETRTLKLKLLGRGGSKGIVLDGMQLKPKSW